MMDGTHPPGEFPCACPQCQSVTGFPFSARTDANPERVCIELRCRHCGHEWMIERTSPPLIPSRASFTNV